VGEARRDLRVAQQKKDKGVEIDEAEVTKINAEKTGAKKKLIAEVAMGGYSRVFKALRKRSRTATRRSPFVLIDVLQGLT